MISKLETQIKQLKESKVEIEEYDTTVGRVVTLERELNTIKQDDSIKNILNDLTKKIK